MTAPAASSKHEVALGKSQDARLVAWLWQFIKPHWRLLLLSLVMIPLAVGLELLRPYLLKIAIDQYIAVGKLAGQGEITLGPIAIDIGGLSTVVLVFLVVVALWALSSYAQMYALQLLGQRSMHGLRLRIYGHVVSQRAAFFDRMPVGRLLTRMTADVESINEMFAGGVVTLVADGVKLVGIVVAMFLLNPKLTLITFLVLPLLAIVVEYARRLMRAAFREVRVKLAAMNSFSQEHLMGIRVVQLFARQRAALADYNEINGAYRDAYHRQIRADASMYALVEAIGIVSIACIAWYASGQMSVDDAATIGLVVAFVEYVRMFFIPIRDFSAKYAILQSAMAATERIVELLDQDEPDAPVRPLGEADRAPKDTGDAGPKAAEAPVVSFRNVCFAYREDEPVLRGVSFDISRGQTVAVVGATGSGKSTLVKLLARLYEIDRGEIHLAGDDIRDIDPATLRKQVTVISQDVFLFAGTVAENVTLGSPDAPEQHIRDALDRVGATRMLRRRLRAAGGEGKKLEATSVLDLEIAERGSNFSAGERQLIAFARALARDPEVLVLDEATAHVDPEAEIAIEKGVAELMRGRTTLVIAHRLSTIRNADLILVMGRGRIVERGSHDELIAKGGVYARLERTFSRHD